MNQASNASGTTHTTVTILEDDNNSSIGSTSMLGLSNGLHKFDLDHDHERDHDTTSNTTVSQNSQCNEERMRQSNIPAGAETVMHRIFCYRKRVFIEFDHLPNAFSEAILTDICRSRGILPNTRLLFGLRVFEESQHGQQEEWCLPCQELRVGVTYCIRMRFKVPTLDDHLRSMDPNAYEYLYNQMRYDVVHECIPSIRYPEKKDYVMGLGAVDMCIDWLERREAVDRIEANYKRYLPRPLVKAHKIFIKRKICGSFSSLRERFSDVALVKWNYVLGLNNLVPDYLLETFEGIVDFIPSDVMTTVSECGGPGKPSTVKVDIKLDLFDTSEPCLKVARRTNKEKEVSL